MPVYRKRFPECPIERTLASLSGRWKAMLVWQLLPGARRYSELVRRVPDAPPRVLTVALHELELDGIVRRSDGRWELTELGLGLAGVLGGMYEWGQRHAATLPDR